ncbi:MAG: Ig-like domain repeat protein [Anaerolineales bacterium]|nr:Ig-like domain repeat protein [Anaerolineales bacterium]
MQNKLIPGLLVIVFFVFSGCKNKTTVSVQNSTAVAGVEKEAPISATMSELSGSVLVRGPLDEAYTDGFIGYVLLPYGQVMTKTASRVRLDLSNGSIIRLSADTLFSLQPTEQESGNLLQRLRLDLGKLWVILNGGSLEVQTPSGLASVRGSYMSVSYDPETGEVKVTCLEGTCALENEDGRVELTAGMTAVITNAGGPPVIGEMDEADIQEWLENNPEATLVIPLLTATSTAYTATSAAFTATAMTATSAALTATAMAYTATPVPTSTQVITGYVIPPETDEPAPVTKLTPAVSIGAVTPTSSIVGQNVSVDVSVTGTGAVPTGTVQVRADGVSFCSATLSGGMASCVGAIPAAGTPTLTAYYAGDAQYTSAVSSNVPYSVSPSSTTTTITTQSPYPSLVGSAVTFEATVDPAAPGAGAPTGSVTFSDGVDSCNVSFAPWTCAIIFTSSGPHSVTATYSGGVDFIGSTSAPVTQDVMAGTDSEFLNVVGPNLINVTSAAMCTQGYSVKVLDIDGVSNVYVEYLLLDDTFMNATTQAGLTAGAGYTWTGSISIPGSAGEVAFWRFIAVDGLGNYTFFGAGVPYINGYPGTTVDAYLYSFDVLFPGPCPVVP